MIAGAGALLGYFVAHGAAAILGARLGNLATRTGSPGIAGAAAVVKATRGWLSLLTAIAIAPDFLRFSTAVISGAAARRASISNSCITYSTRAAMPIAISGNA